MQLSSEHSVVNAGLAQGAASCARSAWKMMEKQVLIVVGRPPIGAPVKPGGLM